MASDESGIVTLSFLSECCNDLPERYAAIIRRHTLMPVWAKSFLTQPYNRTLTQVTVLETAAG